jgi:photosystem II stability/assembly factor-like uncharacterized protein
MENLFSNTQFWQAYFPLIHKTSNAINLPMRSSLLFLLIPVFAAPSLLGAQQANPFTKAAGQRTVLRSEGPFNTFPVREPGPSIMGGRVVDVEVFESSPETFFVALASGGLFRTTNNGHSFEPIFDNQVSLGIGDIAVHPSDANVLWVGAGENNSSRSSYAGAGVYKTSDGGKNWTFLTGMADVQHVGRIVLHPSNTETAWVASIGNLYTKDVNRGVYKTTDGGKTWKKTLFVSDSTGVIDLAIDPKNPARLWAAAWERDRKAWNFKEGGSETGIYVSTDAGETWTRAGEGLPKQNAGRIGLAVAFGNSNIVYAALDNQNPQPKKAAEEKTGEKELTANNLRGITAVEFGNLKDERLEQFLRSNGFPSKYTAKSIKQDVVSGKITPGALAEYTGDANQALFDADVIGLEVYRSDDGGITFKKMNTYPLDRVAFTYGYYFGQIRVAPSNDDMIITMGVPLIQSEDAGKTWKRLDRGDVHVDHHAVWIDPKNPKHLILGNDGGLYTTYDGGANWMHHNFFPAGQFYTVSVDMATPYNIYGGLQDNGVYFGPSTASKSDIDAWKYISGGDGMYVLADPRNNNIVYSGFQFGNYNRYDRASGRSSRITPTRDIGVPPYRFNWRTPVEMSPHNADILYFGSQFVHRSVNKGDNWTIISPDLTRNKPQGDVPYSTISIIEESPLQFGLLWVGTDDGNVWVSENAGGSWTQVNSGLPDGLWVSEIQPSAHDAKTAYVTLTGYRNDDFTPHLYKTTDGGKSWASLAGNLPHEAVNVIQEDLEVSSLLFAGTDHGTYVSLNGGQRWELLGSIPNVASYDMVIHPREGELVVATHGRSFYIADVKQLRAIARKAATDKLLMFQQKAEYRIPGWMNAEQAPYETRRPEPSLSIPFFSDGNMTITVSVTDKEGNFVYHNELANQRGYSTWRWNLKGYAASKKKPKTNEADKVLAKGTYAIVFESGSEKETVSFEMK